MYINFLAPYRRLSFDDKDLLESIAEKISKELEKLPESEVEFEIISKNGLRSRTQLFQGRLVVPFVKSSSFGWLCNLSETIFNQPTRIEKIWMMLQIFSCCTMLTLDRPIANLKKFSPIINPCLALALKDEGSLLRQLPNDILFSIAKIILVGDLKDHVDPFVKAVMAHHKVLQTTWEYRTRAEQDEHVRLCIECVKNLMRTSVS